MLCWSKVADSNSGVQDRNHSTKVKADLFVTEREMKKTDPDGWQVKSRGRGGSKIRKVEVATQKGRVKIYVWIETKESGDKHDVKRERVRHLQASSDNSLNTPGARCTRRRKYGLPAPPSTFWIHYTNKMLRLNVCLHTSEHMCMQASLCIQSRTG